MRTLIALAAMLLAACSDDATTNPEGGPALGYWTLSDADLSAGWNCHAVPSDEACSPPEPFVPTPAEIHLTRDAIEWTDAVAHDGVAGGDCFDVPAAREHGHERSAYAFCKVRDSHGELVDGSAAVVMRWDENAPGDCLCAAFFDYVGP